MRPDQFNPKGLPPGSKDALDVTVADLGDGPLRVTVLVARGAEPGPTIAVLGGVHGDEYEGPLAVRETYSALRTSDMRGLFLGVPQANLPAFLAGTRTSPIDGGNLARVFPGSPEGTATERIANFLAERVIGPSDLLIDLHSSGSSSSIPSLVGYDANDSDAGRASREAALAFGLPVVWGHPDLAPGRSVTEANARGIPWLYTETFGGGTLHRDSAMLYARGVKNVMKHMGILDGSPDRDEVTHHLIGPGNLDQGIRTHLGGYLVCDVAPLDVVRRGDLLGRVLDLAGDVLEEVRAPEAGVVILARVAPPVAPGEVVFAITQKAI